MLKQSKTQPTLAQLIARWRENPDAFVREVIKASPDPWQVVALRALRSHKRVSIAACHGVGKDALAAWAVLWVMFCFGHPKIPCTAPTSHQLYDLLWSEIAKWYARIHPAFRAMFELKNDRFEYKKFSKTWFAVARTARKENSEALQGFHADNVLIVVDEASGVPSVIFEVLEGAMTGPNAMQLLIGNPTQTSGFFYDSHHSDRARWFCMRIAAAETGEKAGSGVWVSDRPSAAYCAAMEKKYGRDSNVYRVRVCGLFPRSEDDQTVPLEWVESAAMRELRGDCPSAVSIGVDVARFGSDASAVVVREGPNLIHAEAWHGNDLASTTGRVIALGNKTHADRLSRGAFARDERLYFFVDSTGIGAGVADNLRAHVNAKALPWTVIDVDAGAKSPEENCMRKRDALWWRCREWFRAKEPAISRSISWEMREQLIGELASPKYGFTPTGEIKVESKDEMKKRGIPSPNLADALIHTFDFEAMKPEPPKPTGWRDRMKQSRNSWETS